MAQKHPRHDAYHAALTEMQNAGLNGFDAGKLAAVHKVNRSLGTTLKRMKYIKKIDGKWAWTGPENLTPRVIKKVIHAGSAMRIELAEQAKGRVSEMPEAPTIFERTGRSDIARAAAQAAALAVTLGKKDIEGFVYNALTSK
jgi:hypothetical protein